MPKAAGDDPYRVLGIHHGASDAEIAAAYRTLARRFHPDLAGEGATVQMMRINLAFHAIRDADHRLAWQTGDDVATVRQARAAERSTTGKTPSEAPVRDHRRSRPAHDGTGGAGPPPGRPSGTVLDFGRHIGWSIGEIARVDPGYLEWLEHRREGRPHAEEIDATLRRVRFRTDPDGADPASTRSKRSGRSFRR